MNLDQKALEAAAKVLARIEHRVYSGPDCAPELTEQFAEEAWNDFAPDAAAAIEAYLSTTNIRYQALEEAATLIEQGFTRDVAEPYMPDGRRTKNDKCPHGRYMYEDCEQCCAAAIRALVKPE